MNKCIRCERETKNPKFCSRSCSASVNNSAVPKRQKQTRLCKYCKASTERTVCFSCKDARTLTSDHTLGEVKERKKDNKWGRANFLNSVVGRARTALIKAGRTSCEMCGYSKHFQAAHIRGRASFPDSAKISEVNALDNLMALCPNCHWEFDHPDGSP